MTFGKLIHDDPDSPATVWRVQDSSGRGPYTTYADSEGKTRAILRDEIESIIKAKPKKERISIWSDTMRRKKPSPAEDFEEWPRWSDSERSALFYAFRREEDAEKWFGPKVWDVMESAGYRLSPVKAKRVYLSKSKKQVAYEPALSGMGALPIKGRIPLATAKRALNRLGRKAKACGITPAALREGMEIEREHRDITKGRVLQTAKIAAAHICERPDYYKRIKRFVER